MIIGNNNAGCIQSLHCRQIQITPLRAEKPYGIAFFWIPRRIQQGFGIQKVYTADKRIDEIYTIEENDTVAIAEGYHPLAAAPGYDMYYLWTMTGANNRGLISSKDPKHAWVK